MVIEPQFQTANDFSNGLCVVQFNDGKWGYIDPDGNLAISTTYVNRPSNFREGYAVVRKQSGDLPACYIDKTGNIVAEGFHSASLVIGGYAYVEKPREGESYLRQYVLDKDFKTVHEYTDENRIKGRALDTNIKWYVDGKRYATNMMVNELGYELMFGCSRPFYDGWAYMDVRYPDGRYYKGFIREDGEVAILFRKSEF